MRILLYTDCYTVFRRKIINLQGISLQPGFRQIKTVLFSIQLHLSLMIFSVRRSIYKGAASFVYSGKGGDFFLFPVDNRSGQCDRISIGIRCLKSNAGRNAFDQISSFRKKLQIDFFLLSRFFPYLRIFINSIFLYVLLFKITSCPRLIEYRKNPGENNLLSKVQHIFRIGTNLIKTGIKR